MALFFGYAAGMTVPDLPTLLALSFKAERACARKLLRAAAAPNDEAALRTVLEQAAGADGLDALLAARRALLAAAAARSAERQAAKAAANALRVARHAGPPTPWRAWFDGSAHPNPGRCGIGALLLGPAGERVELARAAGYGNSSEAEYRALIALLEAAVDAGARNLTIYGDSRVVVDDMDAAGGMGAPSLAPLRAAAQALLPALGQVALRWIPRHKNGAADALSQRAVRQLITESADS